MTHSSQLSIYNWSWPISTKKCTQFWWTRCTFLKKAWLVCPQLWTKIQQTKIPVTCQRFGDLFWFGLVWSGSILQFRQNIIKVGSKSCLLTCSSNITLSLPSYTGSALKKELNFCNGYLSLPYFCFIVLELHRAP